MVESQCIEEVAADHVTGDFGDMFWPREGDEAVKSIQGAASSVVANHGSKIEE